MNFSAPLRALVFALLITGGVGVHAQAPPAAAPVATYDAVSIKPSKGDGRSWRLSTRDTIFAAEGISIRNLVANAYGVRAGLVFGLPAWAESAYFDINAKVTDPDLRKLKEATDEQRRAMLAKLLTERFELQIHPETKVLPVYELMVAPDGPKFKEDPPPPADSDEAAKNNRGHMGLSNGVMDATAVPLARLTALLSDRLDRSVIDKTGLTHEYDLHLAWTPEERAMKGDDNGATDAPPDIFTALKQQLGLRLATGKAPVQTIVVDQVVMPEFD